MKSKVNNKLVVIFVVVLLGAFAIQSANALRLLSSLHSDKNGLFQRYDQTAHFAERVNRSQSDNISSTIAMAPSTVVQKPIEQPGQADTSLPSNNEDAESNAVTHSTDSSHREKFLRALSAAQKSPSSYRRFMRDSIYNRAPDKEWTDIASKELTQVIKRYNQNIGSQILDETKVVCSDVACYIPFTSDNTTLGLNQLSRDILSPSKHLTNGHILRGGLILYRYGRKQ